MRIFDLIWVEGNEDRIAQHVVALEEVEEDMYDERFVSKGWGGTYRVISKTLDGRISDLVVK